MNSKRTNTMPPLVDGQRKNAWSIYTENAETVDKDKTWEWTRKGERCSARTGTENKLWLQIEICENVVFSKIDITMTTINKKL